MRAEFRAFVDAAVAPYAGDFDRLQEIPRDTLRRVAEQGYFGAVMAESSGGTGMDMVTLGELHEEVGRGCSSLRSLLTVHTMASATIDRWGSAEVRAEWLPGLASGERLGAFCLTEPEAGSDPASGTAAARRDGSGYRLDGVKRWITGGEIADALLVFASTENGPATFVVDAGAPGVERIPIRDVLGTRASMLAEIRFDGCRVPESALIGREGTGGMLATSALDLGRYSVAAGCVGILQACLDACVGYTAGRHQGGRLLKDHQLVRQLVSDMVTRLRAARLLCRHAGELKDRGDPATVSATWIAKYFASTSAMRSAADAVQLHGANGCGDSYPVNRYFRDAKIMEIIEGSTQIQQLTIADTAYQPGADPLLAPLEAARS
jgi:alkylation response protein AidB-like acyl-CoA dehydrogenase